MPPTTDELEELAQAYAVTIAPRLAFAVSNKDAPAVADLLEDLNGIQLRALAVVLASQIPQPRTRPNDGVVDEVAIARMAAGEEEPLSRPERAELVRLLASQGVTWTEIARRLHMSTTSVRKILEEAA